MACASPVAHFALFVGYTAALVAAVQFYSERRAQGDVEREMKYAALLCGFRAAVNLALFLMPSLRPRNESVKQKRSEPPPEMLPTWQMFEVITDLCTVLISPFLICVPFALSKRYKLGFVEVPSALVNVYVALSTLGVAYAFWSILNTVKHSYAEMDDQAGRKNTITFTSKQKEYAMCLNVPRLILGAAALFLGYGVHQKYQDPFLLLGSLICICLGVLGGERESGQLHDLGLLMFIFTAFKADLDFRSEHVVML